MTDPLGAPVDARWGRIDDGRCAVVEMAAASGLTLLRAEELDAGRASTLGTGQLLAHALDSGVERILVGVGGSATNDGGAGIGPKRLALSCWTTQAGVCRWEAQPCRDSPGSM